MITTSLAEIVAFHKAILFLLLSDSDTPSCPSWSLNYIFVNADVG